MKKIYGSYVEGMSNVGDKYGFLDEIQIRWETGLALIFATYSFISIVFFGYFIIPSFIIGALWLDFLYKVFIKPKSFIFSSLAQILRKKFSPAAPFYLGAVQKRFAWSLGLLLSTFAFVCVLIVSGFLPSYGIALEPYNTSLTMTKLPGTAVPFSPPLVACLLCIIFMSLESIWGYCVGCRIYKGFVKIGILKSIF